MALIEFLPCPKCGSRDNLAHYSNGKWCFGCGYMEKDKSLQSRFNERIQVKGYDGIVLEKTLDLDHLKWLLQYNLTELEMQQFHSCKERVIKGSLKPCNLLVLMSSTNYWQGRNFDDGVKYLSSGNKPYKEYGNSPDVLVFVEDVISAVKVCRVATAVPMLGAKVPREWWQEVKPYSRVVIWGDRDKAVDNIKAARQASEILGRKVEVVITEKDPKEFNTEEIKNNLTNN